MKVFEPASGTTAENTVVQKFNHGVCTDVLYYHPCLNFLVLFLSREKVHREKYIKDFCVDIVLYFLCLDAKKVTKKDQGKPDRSARFALPSPHFRLRRMHWNF